MPKIARLMMILLVGCSILLLAIAHSADAHGSSLNSHAKGMVPKSVVPVPRLRRQVEELEGSENNGTTAAAGGEARKKREEDDDTPMHEGEDELEEMDKSDVGLTMTANDTATTEKSGEEASTPDTTSSETTTSGPSEASTVVETSSASTEGRKKRENPEKEPFGGEKNEKSEPGEEEEPKAELKSGADTSGQEAEQDQQYHHLQQPRIRNKRASATNNKAKQAVKNTKGVATPSKSP